MDTKKIDYLYSVYNNENMLLAESVLKSAYMSKERDGGGQVLIDNLKEYVTLNAQKLSSFFESDNTGKLTDDEVLSLVSIFEYLAEAVEELCYQKLRTEYSAKQIDDSFEGVSPQQLFQIDINLIKEAYDKDCDEVQNNVSEDSLNDVLRIISYVKEKKSLTKVFGSNNWQNARLEDILYALYDYHKKNDDIFKPTGEGIPFLSEYEYASYFKIIKENCAENCSRNFERYRPSFISKKNLTPELKKLVFCKNLLEYYRTGVLVSKMGVLTNSLDDYYGEKDLKHNFNLTYNKKYNYDEFKTKQGNYIFAPEYIGSEPESLISDKAVKKDDTLSIGFLLKSGCESYYLLHIFLKDYNNLDGTYEIQLNILPDENIENRAQLIRFDNWETKQTHKNIAKKLNTSTHIHLYNHLDLLRGKTNGGFDIAYNIEDKNTNFVDALDLFFKIANFDFKLKDKLHRKVLKAIEAYKSEELSKE